MATARTILVLALGPVAYMLAAAQTVAPAPSSGDYPWARRRQDFPDWRRIHQWYVDEVNTARGKGGIQLLFYGDSITQCWRFGAEGNPIDSLNSTDNICSGAPAVFAKYFGGKYNAKVFGIGGDQTSELMYRLLHGEAPDGLQTKVAVLLIGTNDLGYALDKGQAYMDSIVPSVWDHVEAIADYLAARVQHVILLGIFHRGNWHEPAQMFVQPSQFTAAINTINTQLQEYVDGQEKVHYLNCGQGFFTADGKMLNKDLLPDALHPNAAGFELLARCLEDTVAQLMSERPQNNASSLL